MSVHIVWSSLALAVDLWRYGEPALAQRALETTNDELIVIGGRAGQLFEGRVHVQVWPGGPSSSARPMLVAFIEAVEGSLRPPARNRRLPARSLPAHLRFTDEERWEASREAMAASDRRRSRDMNPSQR